MTKGKQNVDIVVGPTSDRWVKWRATGSEEHAKRNQYLHDKPQPEMTQRQQLWAIKNRLSKAKGGSKSVIIVGAGIAGLAAAELLQRSDHEVLLLEARDRVGGRIYTERDFFDDGLFAEMGAMRIPKAHKLTRAYVKRFELKEEKFITYDARTYVRLRGESFDRENVSLIKYAFTKRERDKTPEDLLKEKLSYLINKLENISPQARLRLMRQYDKYSVTEYLHSRSGGEKLSQRAIEMIGLVLNLESRMNSSFVEFLAHEYSLKSSTTSSMLCLKDGMDTLPNKLRDQLEHKICYGAVLEEIFEMDRKVIARYRTADCKELQQVEAEYLIVTIPFSLMRHILVNPRLSKGKVRAIRQVKYDAASKVYMQFKGRIWEGKKIGIKGGSTITDQSIRNVYYQQHKQNKGGATDRGLLLASYTWGQDSTCLASMDCDDLKRLVLRQLKAIHPGIEQDFEKIKSHHWGDDPYAGGVGVLLEPYQYNDIFNDMVKPEGRIYFAGDHCSRFQTRWIQGALESAIQTASDVHNAPR